jgi:hypothetical protein
MSTATTRADRAAMSPAERAAWIALRCERLGVDASAVYATAYTSRGMDPDTFVLTFGIGPLNILLGYDAATPPDLARFYAWEERHPEEARRLREAERAWLDRLDAADLERLRRRNLNGASAREAAVMEKAERMRETARAAEQERAIREARSRQPSGARDPFARASAYLDRCEGGTSGAGRNPKAWQTVRAIVRGFGLTEGEAERLLSSDYAPRCKPRLPRAELLGMIRRAARASSPPWGYLLERGRR